jgi:hypothetical protein
MSCQQCEPVTLGNSTNLHVACLSLRGTETVAVREPGRQCRTGFEGPGCTSDCRVVQSEIFGVLGAFYFLLGVLAVRRIMLISAGGKAGKQFKTYIANLVAAGSFWRAIMHFVDPNSTRHTLHLDPSSPAGGALYTCLYMLSVLCFFASLAGTSSSLSPSMLHHLTVPVFVPSTFDASHFYRLARGCDGHRSDVSGRERFKV